MDCCRGRLDGLLEAETAARQKTDESCLSAPNGLWREKVALWCYDVVDHLGEQRSLVHLSMNILDRYCATRSFFDEKTYEVASLSSIFLAVRIAGRSELLVEELLSMSRGGITTQDIVSTGTAIIEALSWEHRLVTPIEFVKSLLELTPLKNFGGVLDATTYLIEIAVCDVVLSNSRASRLAVAAILNALRSTSPSEVPAFAEAVLRATSIQVHSKEIAELCSRLEGIYSRSFDGAAECFPHLIEDDEDEESVVSQDDFCTKRSCDDFAPNVQPLKRIKRVQ